MTLWVELGGDPPRGFYAGTRPPAAPALADDRLISVGAMRWGAHLTGGDEAANGSILIDNADAELTNEFASGHYRRAATVYDDTAAVFSGLIDRVRIGTEITLDLVADGLSQPLALRRTTVWAAPYTDAVIPHIIGKQTVQPIRYRADGRQWLLADHACAGVVSVTVDDAPVAGFAMANSRDELGHSICLLLLNEPVDDDQALHVTVRGLTNAAGELAQNPADIIVYLVATIGGQALAAAELDAFRAECARAPVALNLLFADDTATYRAEIDRIMRSAGGVWSPGLPGFARLAPDAVGADEPFYYTLDALDDFGEAGGALDDIATELTVEFDHEPARGVYRQSMTLKAQAAEDAYGRRPAVLQCGALADRRTVLALATRVLEYRARPRWRLPVAVSGALALAVPPGVFVNVTATHLPIAGTARVVEVERNYADNSATLELEQAVGAAPAITLVQSSQLASATAEPVTVDYQDGVAVITARGPDGSLLPGATVTLNGISRTANAQGQARFVIDPGIYELRVNADGFDEQIITAYRVGL